MKTKLMPFALLTIALASCARTSKPPIVRSVSPADSAAKPAEEPEAPDSGADAARDWFLKRRVLPGETELPADRQRTAIEHAARMPQISLADGATLRIPSPTLPGEAPNPNDIGGRSWTYLGPGNIGGRTRSLVINPQNPSIMYAGAVTGGVWKTTDAGLNWNVLTDSQSIVNIGAITMDPTDPNTLYVGTGEFFQGWQGQGIFKTTDGGTSWTPLTFTSNNFRFVYTNKIVISPTNSKRLYAATANGIFTSPDAGITWTQILSEAQVNQGCGDLVIRTDGATDILFAACSGKIFTDDYGIWRNTDAAGAGTFVQVHTAAHMRRTTLALAPSKQATIYALATSFGGDPNYSNGLLAVFRSTSNGDPGTWTTQVANTDKNPLNTALLSDVFSLTTAVCGGAAATYRGQGGYDNIIAVDPLDPNRVWAGGIQVFRSDDGGANWGYAAEIHPDNHIFTFHPKFDGVANQQFFIGNDGGLFRTDNARAAVSGGLRGACSPEYFTVNQVKWTNLNNSYGATQFYHGSLYPGGLSYFGGTQDNGTPRGADSKGRNGWASIKGGDGAATAIDPADANTIFASSQYLTLSRSNDGGRNFVAATRGITEDSQSVPFISFVAMDPHDGRRLYFGGSTNLWRTADSGNNWTSAAPIPEKNSGITAIAVSPFDSNLVLFGTYGGSVYRGTTATTGDGTTAWPSSLPRRGFVGSIAFDPVNPLLVYVTYGSGKFTPADSHVYRSFDGGLTWSGLDGSGAASLPDTPAWRLLIDPRNPSNLYLGSDLGLFVSTDAGATWARDPNGFVNAILEDLAFDQPGSDASWLAAFTFGRGAWKVPLPGSNAATCSYAVSPSTINSEGGGGYFPVTVTTQPGCAWMAIPASSGFAAFQAPARGVGSGSAFVVVPPSTNPGVRTDSITVAGQAISISQGGFSLTGAWDDAATALVLNVPIISIVDTRKFTSAATDPVHSCTGSSDFKTEWFQVRTQTAGVLEIRALARRFDGFGNSGLVVTAYAAEAPSTELRCAVVPRDTIGNIEALVRVPVKANGVYFIEFSATGNTAQDGGNTTVTMVMGQPDPATTISPATAKISAGGTTQAFTATVTGVQNTAVRWTLSPAIGTISTSGVYTSPAYVDSPVTVTIAASPFADPTRTVTATVTVAPPPTAITGGVLNAATNLPGTGVAPGEFIVIKGNSLGPKDIVVNARVGDGLFANTLAGTRVLFDGKPAPVYYASSGQVSAIVPYGIAGQSSTKVTVEYSGQASAAVTVPVVAAAPGLFTALYGPGQAAMLNQDNLFNSAAIPAPRGSIVVFFGTGEGQTNPPGVDGKFADTVFPKPIADVSLTIGGKAAPIYYAGTAPLEVAGVLQINAGVPLDVDPGDAVPVVLKIGGATARTDVTMAVLAPDATRSGRVAYFNNGADDVTVKVFAPGSQSPSISVNVPAGRNNFLSSFGTVQNDWGVQAANSAVRVIGYACTWQTALGGYWYCTGKSSTPFPK